MVFFIRAKSYYKYASDLFKDLSSWKDKPEEFRKKAREIFQIGLKSLWSLSQVAPPEKSPTFEEIWKKALEALDEEERIKLKNLRNLIFSEDISIESLSSSLEEFFKILRKNLKPLL